MERRAGTASYPNMALEILRSHAVCKAISDGRVLDKLEMNFSHAVETVISALNGRTMGTHQSTCLEALSSAALTWVLELMDAVDPRRELRRDRDQIDALRQMGFELGWIDDDAVSGLPGTALVLAVSEIRRLRDIEGAIRSGRVLGRLEHVWGSVTRAGTVDEVVTELNRQGVAGQDLAWAAITFETHKHTNLIWHQANKLERSFPDRQASDLFGWGWMGLRIALRQYNPSLGFTFSTYACIRIQGTIRDGVRQENPVPKRLTTYARKYARVEEELTQKLGKTPTLDEIAARLGEDISQLSIVPRLAPAASIEEIVEIAGERGGVPHWMVDSSDPASEAVDLERARAINDALEMLPEDERDAVKLLVMEALSPTEARVATGATARQMRQRREKGLATLRGALAQWAPVPQR